MIRAKSIAGCVCATVLMFPVTFQVRAQSETQPQAWATTSEPALVQDRNPGVAVLRSQVSDIELNTGERCRISIVLPDKPPSERGYPIFYYVDGGQSAAAAFYSDILGRARRDSAVLVGMACTQAAAPTKQLYTSAVAQALSSEVVPNVERDLEQRVSVKLDTRRRSLYGRGEDGRLVLQAMYSRPDAFQTYIVSSPRLDKSDHALLEAERRFLANHRNQSPQLVIIVAGHEPYVERGRQLYERLRTKGEGRLHVSFKEFPDLDFLTVAPAALSHAFDAAL